MPLASSALTAAARSAPARRAVSRRSPTSHRSRGSRSIGNESLTSSEALPANHPSRSRRKALTGCSTKRTSESSCTTSPLSGGRRPARKGRGARRGAERATAPSRLTGSKLAGSLPLRLRAEVAGIERLQRVLHQHPLARRCGVAVETHGSIDHIEELGDGHGGGTLPIGALVAAAEGDDQMIGRGQHGVEEQLAVLAPGIPVADVRIVREHVVTVPVGVAGEDAVVEPEQAHHPVRHRPHRDQGADREIAGAEVRPGRPALEAFR